MKIRRQTYKQARSMIGCNYSVTLFSFSQQEQAEQASYGDESLITEMRDEFSKRMGEMNTKLNKAVKVLLTKLF